MPGLSLAQRRTGRELGSASAVADSKQTLLCTYLSAAVLLGLVLNAALGWWWADPIVALGLAAVAVTRGPRRLRGPNLLPRAAPRRKPGRWARRRGHLRLRGWLHRHMLHRRDEMDAAVLTAV